jgi:mRNA deadenylase 3'-5' endonuclease subunit Ccr4
LLFPRAQLDARAAHPTHRLASLLARRRLALSDARCAIVLLRELTLSFSIASYNLLASAYLQRAWYPRTPALVLDPAWRVPALAGHIAKLGADIFCLQEVEPETFVALRTTLSERGYGAQYARKLARRPDGVAIFYRRNIFELLSSRVIAFADGKPATGYVALLVLFGSANGVLGVINTHLMWDAPGTRAAAQIGLRQAHELVAEHERSAADGRGWIVAGDFNVTPQSEIVALMTGAGFSFAHRDLTNVRTCNVGAKARLIDYLFHSNDLVAEAVLPAPIDDATVLPSAEEPSDHVALMARFAWRA